MRTEGYTMTMTSKEGHHGGGSQPYPNQCFVNIKTAGKNVLSRLRTLFQDLSSIYFRWQLLFLYMMAFMLSSAHGEEQAGLCQLLGPAITWDMSSAANFETLGLCPRSPTQQLPMQGMNICIPTHVHLNVEILSPDLPLGPPIPSKADVKVVVVTVLAIIGGLGFVGRMLYKRYRPFTEADINRVLMSEPAVARRSNPTFEILPSID